MSFFESEKILLAIFSVLETVASPPFPLGLSGTQSADFETGFRSHVFFFLVYLFLAALALPCGWALVAVSRVCL